MKFKLSYRKGSTVLLSMLMLAAVGIIFFAQKIKVIGVRSYIAGPKFYPILVGALMIFFCVLSLIEVWRKPEQVIELENVHRPAIIFLICGAWAALWQLYGNFYLFSAFFAALIMFYLNPQPVSPGKALKSAVQSGCIMLVIYLVFSVMLKIRI